MRRTSLFIALTGLFGIFSHAQAADVCTDRFNTSEEHYQNAKVDCILHWERPNSLYFEGNTVFTQAGNENGHSLVTENQNTPPMSMLNFKPINGSGSVTYESGSTHSNYGNFYTDANVHFIINAGATFSNGGYVNASGPVDIYGTYVNGIANNPSDLATDFKEKATVHAGAVMRLAHLSLQFDIYKGLFMERGSKLLLDNGMLRINGESSQFLGDVEIGTDETSNVPYKHRSVLMPPEIQLNTQDPHPDHPQEIVFNGLKIRTGQLHLSTNAIVRLTQSVNVTEGGSIGIGENQDVIFEKDLTISGEAKGVRLLNLSHTLKDGTKALLSYLGINTPSGHHKVVIKGKTTISDMAFAELGSMWAPMDSKVNEPQPTIELHDVDVLRNGALYASPEVQLRIKGALRIDQYNPERVFQVPAVWFWNRHNDLSTITTIDVSGGAQLYAAGIGPSQSGEAVINAPIRLQQGTLELGNIFAPNGDPIGPMTNDAVLAGAITATDKSTLKITSGHQLTLRGGDDKTPAIHFASGSSGKIYARQLKVAHGIEVQSGATLMLAGFDSKDKTQVAKDTDLVDVKAIKVDSGGTFYAFNTSRTNFGDIEVGSTPSDTKKSTFGTFFSTGDIHLGGALYAHGYAGDANQTAATINFNSNKISIDKGAGLIKATDGGHITVGKNSMETQMTIQAPIQVEARNPGTKIRLNTVGHSGNADYTMNADSQDAAWVYFLFKNAHTVSGLMNNHIDEGDQSGGIHIFVYAPDAGSPTRSVADDNTDTPFLDWHPSPTSSIDKFACDQCSMLMPARQKPTDDIKVVTFAPNSKASDVTGKFTINIPSTDTGKPLTADKISVLRIDELKSAILIMPKDWKNVPIVYLKRPAPDQLPTIDLVKIIYNHVPDVVSGKLKLKYLDDHRYPNYVRVTLAEDTTVPSTPAVDFQIPGGMTQWMQARYTALTPVEVISDQHVEDGLWARAQYAFWKIHDENNPVKAHTGRIEMGINHRFALNSGAHWRLGLKVGAELQKATLDGAIYSRDRVLRAGIYAVYSSPSDKRVGVTVDYEHFTSELGGNGYKGKLTDKAIQVGLETSLNYTLSNDNYVRPGLKLQWSRLYAASTTISRANVASQATVAFSETDAVQWIIGTKLGHRYHWGHTPMDSWMLINVIGDLNGSESLKVSGSALTPRSYAILMRGPYLQMGLGTEASLGERFKLQAELRGLIGYYWGVQANMGLQWLF